MIYTFCTAKKRSLERRNMNLRIALKPQEGYNKIFDVGEYGMKLTKFGLLKLAKGGVYEGDTGETEVAFVLMGGNFAASVRSGGIHAAVPAATISRHQARLYGVRKRLNVTSGYCSAIFRSISNMVFSDE